MCSVGKKYYSMRGQIFSLGMKTVWLAKYCRFEATQS
jgi:hypothetical protein